MKEFTRRQKTIAGLTSLLVLFGLLSGCLSINPPVPTPVYPTYFTSTAKPTLTSTAAPTLAFTPVPVAQVATPIYHAQQAITAKNAARLQLLASWGKGIPYQIAWSPDGAFLAVASTRGLYLYNAIDLSLLQSIEDGASFRQIVFSPNGSLLASASEDGQLHLWAISADNPHRPAGPVGFAVNAHQQALDLAFSADASMLAVSLWDGSVQVWQVNNGAPILTLDSFDQPVQRLAFSSDGADLFTWSPAESVQTWGLPSGKQGRTLFLPARYGSANSNLGEFSANNEWFIASYSTQVRLLRLKDGYTLGVLNQFTHPIQGISLSSGGRTLAAILGSSIQLWQPSTGSNIGQLTAPEASAHPGLMAFSPDGSQLVSLGDRLRLWQVTPQAKLLADKAVDFASDYPLLLDFSKDSKNVTAGFVDGSLVSYNLEDGLGNLLAALTTNDLDSLAFSSAGSLAASSLGDHGFNLRAVTGSSSQDQTIPKGAVAGLSLSADGSLLAVASTDGTVQVRRVSDNSTIQTLQLPSTAAALAFSPDGSLLAVRSAEGVGCWKIKDGTSLAQYDGYSMAFSQNSSLLAITSVIDGSDATRIRSMPDGSLNSVVKDGSTELAFSPDGRLLAISAEGTTLWNTADGSRAAVLPDASPFGRLAFSPDGRLLAQLSADGILRLWGVP
ncbi:MAG: WD40 repeat domain-containing protein [Anaerolineaceae bacterium]|nr:WD40 repeat domain-containing protein [Anaerolineaceae bacterium]